MENLLYSFFGTLGAGIAFALGVDKLLKTFEEGFTEKATADLYKEIFDNSAISTASRGVYFYNKMFVSVFSDKILSLKFIGKSFLVSMFTIASIFFASHSIKYGNLDIFSWIHVAQFHRSGYLYNIFGYIGMISVGCLVDYISVSKSRLLQIWCVRKSIIHSYLVIWLIDAILTVCLVFILVFLGISGEAFYVYLFESSGIGYDSILGFMNVVLYTVLDGFLFTIYGNISPGVFIYSTFITTFWMAAFVISVIIGVSFSKLVGYGIFDTRKKPITFLRIFLILTIIAFTILFWTARIMINFLTA